MNESDLVALHATATANGNYFNNISWVVHGFCIGLLGAILAWVFRDFKLGGWDFSIRLFLGSTLFIGISQAWRMLYAANKSMVFICYDVAKELERKMISLDSDCKVHLSVDRRYGKEPLPNDERFVKTSSVFLTIQESAYNIGLLALPVSVFLAFLSWG